MIGDVRDARKPDAIFVFVFDAVFQRLAKRPEPEWLPDDEAVNREREHERGMLALLDHFIEMIDDHIGKLAAGMVARGHRTDIVEFGGIRYRQ